MTETCRLRRDEEYEVRADEGASRAFVRRCRSQASARNRAQMGYAQTPILFGGTNEQGYSINDPAHAGAI